MRTPLPKAFPRPTQIQSTWKPAKNTARREEAAVALYLLEDVATGFANQNLAWQGPRKTYFFGFYKDIL